MEALKLGFSSVMYDGSAKKRETNIAETREIVKIAHSFGATVEGEIGHVGDAAADENLSDALYTTPEEANEYLAATGVDAWRCPSARRTASIRASRSSISIA